MVTEVRSPISTGSKRSSLGPGSSHPLSPGARSMPGRSDQFGEEPMPLRGQDEEPSALRLHRGQDQEPHLAPSTDNEGEQQHRALPSLDEEPHPTSDEEEQPEEEQPG